MLQTLCSVQIQAAALSTPQHSHILDPKSLKSSPNPKYRTPSSCLSSKSKGLNINATIQVKSTKVHNYNFNIGSQSNYILRFDVWGKHDWHWCVARAVTCFMFQNWKALQARSRHMGHCYANKLKVTLISRCMHTQTHRAHLHSAYLIVFRPHAGALSVQKTYPQVAEWSVCLTHACIYPK